MAQTLPDFSTIKVSSLSDQQIESLMKQAKAMGYSESDILTLAQSQGVNAQDLALLNERFGRVKSMRASQAKVNPVGDVRMRQPYVDSLQMVDKGATSIYGLDIFRRGSFLTFQTSLNQPTPKDYVLGPGDELFIDIYGASESYYQTQVTPEGTIILENLGVIALNGLSVEQAERKIRQRVATVYEGMKGERPNTFLSLSLGQVRSVGVNVIGQVQIPGTYNLSALNTVFNALYAAGGITENGSLRQVKHFRKGKLISSIDIYDYLQRGYAEGDNRLESGDVILVPPYTNRVTLTGAVKVSGKFELLESETLADLLNYAGGFTENALNGTIKLKRISDDQKRVADILSDQYEVFTIKNGDEYTVQTVLNRYTNRVVIQGAVFRPGNYAITDNLGLADLIKKSDGLRPDAFLDRAIIRRAKEDLTFETISVNLRDVLENRQTVILQREDVVTVFSKNELKEEHFIEVLGEVNKPGVLGFADNTSLKDALLMAGGLSNAAFGGSIEVSRRLYSDDSDGFGISKTFAFTVDQSGLATEAESFILSPYDQVYVRRNPNYKKQQLVTIEGQVRSPGQYAIRTQGERISDLLNRAGGINAFAFVEGATLIRKTEFYEEPTDIEQQIDQLIKLEAKFQKTPDLLTEAEQSLLKSINEDIAELEKRRESNQNLSSFAKRERLKEVIERNALTDNIQLKQAEAIGIDLQSIINEPGSVSDLLLEDGDVLIIPKKSETVRLRGKLLYPTTTRFVKGKSLKYYINSAGGFDFRAKKKGTYVVYANGEVARTRSFLFMKFYPKPAPGAEIIVPTKPLAVPVRVQDVLAITSSLATLALVINQISN
ncbi:MAG: SLBB domain-containing protein [Bacteroidota bacterium]|nr:SLBB domain-containing protein [Bacteroidota bacterium]